MISAKLGHENSLNCNKFMFVEGLATKPTMLQLCAGIRAPSKKCPALIGTKPSNWEFDNINGIFINLRSIRLLDSTDE